MKLVIVESPTKARTISKFLGKGFKIESSFGHIRDLPKSKMGIDIENDYQPKYVIPTRARKTVTKLKKLGEKAEVVILASDEDREGEAIAWHLAEAMGLKEKDIKRIVFHEITKDAITKAMDNPRGLNDKLVDAQQARRILDRLVGYELSPFLWRKVVKGLSAGRVQSVAVRLVVEREREIKKFKPDEYWSILAMLNADKDSLEARLHSAQGKVLDKMAIKNKDEADKILADLENAIYKVAEVEKKKAGKKSPVPFKTSTLQQTANRWYGMSAKQTMMHAQRLYESGHITYMRTDSLNLSSKFINDARGYIKDNFSGKYLPAKPKVFKTKAKGAQEAHEAIRPTDAAKTPEDLQNSLEPGQFKLYTLIWQRSVASQMTDAELDNTTIDINANDYGFRASGQIIKFDGFLKVYPQKTKESILPEVKSGQELRLEELKPEQHFTKPPARYSDATLVKELEKHEIGRPSTYAPTIGTIETRNYVERDENKRLKPTDIAFVVNDLLVEHFPRIVDLEFTAKMEDELDAIAAGKKDWQPVVDEFYKPFHENLEEKYDSLKKSDIMPEEKTQEKCDKCGKPMVIKTGRYGKFMGCSGFPECRNIKSLNNDGKKQEKSTNELEEKYKGEKCDKCGEPMAVKSGRYGPFLACTGYPKCKNIKNIQENKNSTGIKCPKCKKGSIVGKRSKRGLFYACDNYPDCKNAYWGKPTGDKCPECQSLLVETKDGVKCSNKGCDFEK